MKPGFALSLSAEGIVLLHRAAGGWRNVGTVALDSADLPAALAELRTKGDALEPGGQCKLIIPNEQIRYLTIETGISDQESRRRLARAALEGATPYAVEELAFDLSEDGSQTHIAAVAQETLAEAESFALGNGFQPVSFVALPGDMEFLGEPFFGTAPSLGAALVEPDGIAVVDIGPAEVPSPKPEPDPKTTPKTKAAAAPAEASTATKSEGPIAPTAEPPALTIPKAPEPVTAIAKEEGSATPEADESGPIAGFSSRRRRPETSAPELPGVERKAAGAVGTAATAVPAPSATRTPPSAGPKTAPANGKAPSATAATAATGAKTSRGSTPGTGANGASAPHAQTAIAAKSATNAPAKSQKPQAVADTSGAEPVPATSQGSASLGMPPTKGKPRYLGLILTAALLLVMAAVAAFALFSEGGLFFSSERAPTEQTNPDSSPVDEADLDTPTDQNLLETAPSTDPASSETPTNDQLLSTTDPEGIGIAPQVSALPDQPDPGLVELGQPGDAAPGQTELGQTELETQASTGQAVLDAFEGDETSEEDAALSAAALYAATGIWQEVPQIAEAPALVTLGDIYIASIDNSDLSQDAVALPTAPAITSDALPDSLSSPAAPGSDFDLDERGLVTATPEGTLNPDGVMIFLGPPPVVPPATPDRPDDEALAAEAKNARIASLSLLRPRPRPNDLVEQAERALLGGLSRAELAKLRPRARPAGLKTEEQENQPVSDLAVTTSVSPRARPANFANLVDRAIRSRNSAAAATANAAAAATVVAPRTVTPSIPSSASVARQATVNNAINLRRLNLIGVSGKPSNRQALVRLSNGRYRKVRVGDRLDGGTVVAIGDSQLMYQKRGTNTTLELPGN